MFLNRRISGHRGWQSTLTGFLKKVKKKTQILQEFPRKNASD
jgi:hypothetical protein